MLNGLDLLENRTFLSALVPDNAFAASGFAENAYLNRLFPTHTLTSRTVATMRRGHTLVVGDVRQVQGPETTFAILAARYRPDGWVDKRFAPTGFVVSGVKPLQQIFEAVKDTASRTVILGMLDNKLVVVRIGLDGRIDESFAQRGYAVVPGKRIFSNTTKQFARIALNRADDIAVGFDLSDGAKRWVGIARFDPTGAAAQSFGDKGVALYPANTQNMTDLAMSDDATVVFSGNEVVETFASDRVFKLDRSGKLVLRFGPNQSGRMLLADLGLPGTDRRAIRDLVTQPDGKIVLSTNDGYIARLTADGRRDSSFVIVRTANLADLLLVDGAVLSAPGRQGAGTAPFSVLRLLPTGRTDTSFDDDGFFTGDMTSDVAILTNQGKILSSVRFGLVRFALS